MLINFNVVDSGVNRGLKIELNYETTATQLQVRFYHPEPRPGVWSTQGCNGKDDLNKDNDHTLSVDTGIPFSKVAQ